MRPVGLPGGRTQEGSLRAEPLLRSHLSSVCLSVSMTLKASAETGATCEDLHKDDGKDGMSCAPGIPG